MTMMTIMTMTTMTTMTMTMTVGVKRTTLDDLNGKEWCKFAIWCLMDFQLRRDCQWTTCAPGTLWAELGWPLHSSTDRNLQIALMEGPSRNGKQEIELLTLLVNGIVGEHMQLPMCSAKQRMDKRRRSLNTAASTVLMMRLSDFVRCPHL